MSEIELRKVVLVAGVPRSGTTALNYVLGNRPDAFSVGEFYAWYRPFRPYHLDPRCECGPKIYDCEHWQRIGRPKASHIHRRIAEVTDTNLVVDSSKNLAWIRDVHRWARADGMAPHVVLTWRHPRAQAYSYWKRGQDWMGNVDSYLDQLHSLRLPFEVFDFDRFVTEPTAVLDGLHTAIGIDTFPGQERFWEGEYHSMFGSPTTRGYLHSGEGRLETTALPEDFLEYWDALPSEVRQRLDDLNDEVLSGAAAWQPSAPPTRLPPRWYLHHRAARLKVEAVTRVQARRHKPEPAPSPPPTDGI